MRLIEKMLDKARPAFAQKGKLAFFHPLFQAVDNLFYSAQIRPLYAPYGRDPIDVKRYMILVIFALVPSFLATVYFFGWRIFLMLIVSYAAGGITEVLFALIRKEEINEGFLVTGFIFPLILPPATPLWLVAVGILFGVVVGKEVFGGTGRNLFNAALVGRLFITLGYPALMAKGWLVPAPGLWGSLGQFQPPQAADALSAATPLVLAKSGTFVPTWELFTGRVMGSAGETSALAILAGGLVLLGLGIANWRPVFTTLAAFAGFNWLFRLINPAQAAPVLFNLLSGGILFGAFFMATDPVSGPVTRAGRWFYGIIIGGLTILIRTFSGFVEGVTFAILMGNICAPVIDQIVIHYKVRRYAHEK